MDTTSHSTWHKSGHPWACVLSRTSCLITWQYQNTFISTVGWAKNISFPSSFCSGRSPTTNILIKFMKWFNFHLHLRHGKGAIALQSWRKEGAAVKYLYDSAAGRAGAKGSLWDSDTHEPIAAVVAHTRQSQLTLQSRLQRKSQSLTSRARALAVDCCWDSCYWLAAGRWLVLQWQLHMDP